MNDTVIAHLESTIVHKQTLEQQPYMRLDFYLPQ